MGIFDKLNKNTKKNKNKNKNNSKYDFNDKNKNYNSFNNNDDNIFQDLIEEKSNKENLTFKQSYFNKAKKKFINLNDSKKVYKKNNNNDYYENNNEYYDSDNDVEEFEIGKKADYYATTSYDNFLDYDSYGKSNNSEGKNEALDNKQEDSFDEKNEIIRPKTLEERYRDDFIESKTKLNRSVKTIAAFILIMFTSVISYLVYFQIVKAPILQKDGGNTRTIEARNRVKRGSIIDRRGNILSESRLNEEGDQERVYHGSIAYSNILGYQSNIYSVTGLESSLDKILSQSFDIRSIFTIDFIKSIISGEVNLNSRPQGHSVKITIDSALQNLSYRLLNGKKGSVVALNPKTGEVLAMVSSPGFDPSDLSKVMKRIETDNNYASLGPLVNKAIDNYYAPGSTFKAVTLASAIANILGITEKTFDDEGEIKFPDGTSLPNLDSHAYGKISLQEGFTYSSNVVFGSLALTLSNAQLKDTAEDFGFNRQVNSQGLVPIVSVFPTHNKSEIGLMAQSGIGQGKVLASPLQMAMVSSAVANNGILMQPQIVSEVIDKNGYLMEEFTPKVFSSPMNNEVAQKVKEFFHNNVASGSSTYSSLQGINGGGKTGTAEFNTEKGFRINSWFIGFAPVEDPKIAIAVLIEDLDNTNENLSSRNATPIAAQIMEEYLNEN